MPHLDLLHSKEKTSHISEYNLMDSVLIWSKFRRAKKALEWSRYRQRSGVEIKLLTKTV
jgi:hypothetical protein